MKIKFALTAMLVIIVIGLFTTLNAAPGGGSTDIIEVLVDYDNNELSILGSHLSDGVTEPIVTLGSEVLTFDSVGDYDAGLIIAQVSDIEAYLPGDYLLTVDPMFKSSKPAEMMLSLGAMSRELTTHEGVPDAHHAKYTDAEAAAVQHDDRYYTKAHIDALISRIEALEAKLADVSVTHDETSGLKTLNISNVGLNITSQSGHSIILDDTESFEKITILDKTGKNGIEIDSSKNSMTFNSDGDYTTVAKGKATLKSHGDFSIDSFLDLTLDSGVNLTLDSGLELQILPGANGILTIGGDQARIEPNTHLKLNTPLTTISAAGVLELKSGLIKLN